MMNKNLWNIQRICLCHKIIYKKIKKIFKFKKKILNYNRKWNKGVVVEIQMIIVIKSLFH
jgi:hypothetical protein